MKVLGADVAAFIASWGEVFGDDWYDNSDDAPLAEDIDLTETYNLHDVVGCVTWQRERLPSKVEILGVKCTPDSCGELGHKTIEKIYKAWLNDTKSLVIQFDGARLAEVRALLKANKIKVVG
jgi:hypothetical protein